MGERIDIEITRTVRRRLPRARWKQPRRGGVLTDALGGFIFVLIVGGFWLSSAAISAHQDADQIALAR